MTRLVISILIHEKPGVVLDQIKNIRKWVPNALIVLHLHRKFLWQPNKPLLGYPRESIVDFSKFENVFVNPKSVRTEWGNLYLAHHENFKYARSISDFDYFALHSSSDLFVRPLDQENITKWDCGVSLVPPQSSFMFDLAAESDTAFQNIKKDAGAKELWTSQVEGTYYSTPLFQELLERIERHHRFDPEMAYVHEEIFYPTIISGLNVARGTPYLMREDKTHLPKFAPALVDDIRSGVVPDHTMKRWKLDRQVESLVWKGEDICAIRPVPRTLEDPLRRYIGELEAA